MAQSTEIVDTNVSTTDLYQIASVVESIKNKYIEVPEDTLVMGVYGYLNEIFTNTIENATRLAAEYANEAVPTRAKFEKNVIAHALSLGINSIQATPAYMECMICIPESNLVANMNTMWIMISSFIVICFQMVSMFILRCMIWIIIFQIKHLIQLIHIFQQ